MDRITSRRTNAAARRCRITGSLIAPVRRASSASRSNSARNRMGLVGASSPPPHGGGGRPAAVARSDHLARTGPGIGEEDLAELHPPGHVPDRSDVYPGLI